jgi:uncharacterized protein
VPLSPNQAAGQRDPFNREDLWQFPRQPAGGEEATMAPYYIIVRLPGEPQAEFLQMLPMVPSQRQNMIA